MLAVIYKHFIPTGFTLFHEFAQERDVSHRVPHSCGPQSYVVVGGRRISYHNGGS